jgi:outer membrane scaffolding protein for murein synthesis (MipA/OmpV family)
MLKSITRGATCALLALAASAATAHAESSLVLGIGVGAMPDYLGSDDYEAVPVPMLKFDWNGTAGSAPASGVKGEIGLIDASVGFPNGIDVGIARLSTPSRHFTLRLGGGYRFGRDADDNDALNGMGDIDGQVVARITLASEPANARGLGIFYGVEYETDVSDETNGDTFTLYAGDKFSLSPKTTLTLTGRTQWADDDFMQSYFGVSGAQAARSRNRAFQAESGFADVGLEANLNYAITEHWMMFGTLGYSRLLGDAADSPLVDGEGSANQFRAFTGVAYRF